MLAALIIVFREVFEAGLIIGIVLAVTGSVPHRNRWIGGGVLAGTAAACVVAAFTGALCRLFEGMGQELFNAAILGVAVTMLTWHNVWMAHHGREIAGQMRAAGQAVADGTKSLLAL
ncbi:MAG TPA: FTR1 family protein, partial [Bradyrhizobium sp.]|nr:FTR1 family protein [Bradyrhizobium sp.]